ncbi:MAG: hypothetical protein B6241_05650 [Spirochaetaceae bacterium 4572_59]|nr:MAG: hypothetical protein B6241_05650 [Spirochaetaceae bacterium 4572_59]
MQDNEFELLEELELISDEDFKDIKHPSILPLFAHKNSGESIDILKNDAVRIWINRNKNSIIPSCLIDRYLNICWTNLEFLKSLIYKDSPVNHNLVDLYESEIGIDLLQELRSFLENESTSYSWRGRVFPARNRETNTFLKVFIKPAVYDQNDIPTAYACCWDIITSEFKKVLQNTFSSLLEASKLKDNDTGTHIKRVNRYSKLLSEKLKGKIAFPEVNDSFIEDIGFLAAMHDVGKIGTPDDILNKGGPLDDWEREIMNEHTKNGAYILSTYPNPMATDIALNHHEQWDGNGYPYGKFEEMIPLSARIVAIADVYDALRSVRSYKKSFSHDIARNIIAEGRGKQFDPNLVDEFLLIENEFAAIFDDMND